MTSLRKHDRAARALWDKDYEAIPKSVFAVVAWHLANVASGKADTVGEAEKRFAEEWDTLFEGGHLPQRRKNGIPSLRGLP